MDYQRIYDSYWSSSDRFCQGLSESEADNIARQILSTCGLGRIADIGTGLGRLVFTMLRQGIDAYGVDVSRVAVTYCNTIAPGRFYESSILNLPFKDTAFETVVLIDCLEHLAEEDIESSLQELYRVCRKNLFLRISTISDPNNPWQLTLHTREWWENYFFAAGFRKHPGYYQINLYEALENDGEKITILLEKIPFYNFLRQHSQYISGHESTQHKDMLRETGRLSDSHIVRYQFASQYIRPGDTVLDVACGMGYGSYVMRSASLGKYFIGIDNSPYAIGYANSNFASQEYIKYQLVKFPDALVQFPENSFDFVVVFEILQYLEEPIKLLQEIQRVLKPGGRIIASYPNCCWGENFSQDFKLNHLHAYTWERLQHEIENLFLPEKTYEQSAGICKGFYINDEGKNFRRRLREVKLDKSDKLYSEWYLTVEMKDPIDFRFVDYRETVFSNLTSCEYPPINYKNWYHNPWIMHSMVNIGYRIRSPKSLMKLTNKLLDSSPLNTPDYGAGLCIHAYKLLESNEQAYTHIKQFVEQAEIYLSQDSDNPHMHRWKISITFVLGMLYLKNGDFQNAEKFLKNCIALDPLNFGIHLATKTTEAYFLLGWLALIKFDRNQSEKYWRDCLKFGERLLKKDSLEEVLINPQYPNIFDHGDGMREFTYAIENITKCANAIHLLKREEEGYHVNWLDVFLSFRHKGEFFARELTAAQEKVSRLTHEVDITRQNLIERTRELDLARQDLIERTRELDLARQDLIERTRELDLARQDLIERTRELDHTRDKLFLLKRNLAKVKATFAGKLILRNFSDEE
ncbi:MAG: methyltransferase domain-containing protein [Candidatus Competibacteraceae bacterium]